MMRIAVAGPSHSDSMPAAKTPSGPVPMDIVTIPITRERIADRRLRPGSASSACWRRPRCRGPPMSSSTKASPYHGDSAIPTTPTRNSAEPRSSARLPSSRSQPGRQRLAYRSRSPPATRLRRRRAHRPRSRRGLRVTHRVPIGAIECRVQEKRNAQPSTDRRRARPLKIAEYAGGGVTAQRLSARSSGEAAQPQR